jgi:hypothetical protein
VALAIVCYGLAACANALAWWLTDIPDAPDGAQERERR